MLASIFEEKEATVVTAFSRISKVSEVKYGLVNNFKRVLQYYDEPKLWQYSSTLNSKFVVNNSGDFKSVSSGVSFFSEKLAILKCLSEAIERYCNFAFFTSSVDFVGTYKSVKNKALDPKLVVGFSKRQLANKGFERFVVSGTSVFSWSGGESLTSNRKILIPSQLVYLSYPRLSNEPTIYPSISTGAASGSCLSSALVRGICEVIERDAFMIFYLNKLTARRVQLDKISDWQIQKLLQISKRYKMEIVSLDITTDIQVPTFLSIVVNYTGVGKAVSLGLKSSLNPIDALVGSIEETFNTRTWLRTEYENNPEKVVPSDLLKKPDIKTRGFLWYSTDVINNLDFLIKSPKSKFRFSTKGTNKIAGKQLKQLLTIFKKLEYDVVYKDITISEFKKLGYFVVKVIIPQMQPFYLNEKYKLLGGKRLYEVPEKLGFKGKDEEDLNKFPHPFL